VDRSCSAKGVHPKIVSEMLGHADISITLDVYSHFTPTMHAQAATAFDERLGEPVAGPRRPPPP
jgi:integrase